MAKKKIKCDAYPKDYITVVGFDYLTPRSINVRIKCLGECTVEFQSPKKVRKLIKLLEKASLKVWGE